jgi:hypothetical protein
VKKDDLPSWADAGGNDERGRFCDLSIDDCSVRCRWMAARTVGEASGFWLSETSCTQAFYEAVLDQSGEQRANDKKTGAQNFVVALQALLLARALLARATQSGSSLKIPFGQRDVNNNLVKRAFTRAAPQPQVQVEVMPDSKLAAPESDVEFRFAIDDSGAQTLKHAIRTAQTNNTAPTITKGTCGDSE